MRIYPLVDHAILPKYEDRDYESLHCITVLRLKFDDKYYLQPVRYSEKLPKNIDTVAKAKQVRLVIQKFYAKVYEELISAKRNEEYDPATNLLYQTLDENQEDESERLSKIEIV